MEKKGKMPIWRKMLIATFALSIVACLIILGNLDNIIQYDYKVVGIWESSDKNRVGNKSHIGNISSYDSRGNRLDEHWLMIGNHYWYANDLEDKEQTHKEYGNLVRLYSYAINDSKNRYNGEEASIWIYDIEEKTSGITKDVFYQRLYNSYLKDTTSIWESTNEFSPLLALTTGAYVKCSRKNCTYMDHFIILGNDRIYCINFSNNKWKLKGHKSFTLFHERCLSVIKNIDFLSYYQWEKDYKRYMDFQDKEEQLRELWRIILYSIILVSGLGVFVLFQDKLGRNNTHARNMALYCSAFFLLELILYIIVFMNSDSYHIFELEYYFKNMNVFIIFDFIPSVAILSSMIVFLTRKSHQDYNSYYLIPEWLVGNPKTTNEFSQRILMTFLAYPFFFVMPIPFVRIFFFIFYFIPASLITGIVLGIMWIREGKEMDAKSQEQYDKAQLYCRHCGELIDADSDYCRYCGKKL